MNTRLTRLWMAGLGLMIGAGVAQAQDAGGSLVDLIKEARQRMIDKHDANGDGKLDADEQADAAESFREEMQEAGKEMRKEWEKQFDKDGDGKLSDAEKAAMEQDWKDRTEVWKDRFKQRMEDAKKKRELDKYDINKDGILSDSEKAKMEADKKAEAERLAKLRAEIIKAYDIDGDGKLSADEVEAMNKKVTAQLEHLKAIATVSRDMQQKDEDKSLAKVEQSIRGFRMTDRPNGWQMWQQRMGANRR